MPTNQNAIDLITRTIAVLALLCVLTICVMSYFGKQIPPELNTLAGGLVGSCLSMLVKTTPTDDKPKAPSAGPSVPAGTASEPPLPEPAVSPPNEWPPVQ